MVVWKKVLWFGGVLNSAYIKTWSLLVVDGIFEKLGPYKRLLRSIGDDPQRDYRIHTRSLSAPWLT